jgi:dipeptidyl-peptidase 4
MTNSSTDHDPTSFPALYALTQRFTLGEPRTFTPLRDGRVVFLRAFSDVAPLTGLWITSDSDEVLIGDPRVLLADGDETLDPAERARRERMREGAGGITSYSINDAATHVVLALSGQLFSISLDTPYTVTAWAVPGPVFDPRANHDMSAIAFVTNGTLRVMTTKDAVCAVLAEPDGDNITWGLADFVAAEELNRSRGYWWLADGRGVVACRVDESPVATWWVSDASQPAVAPRAMRYPPAGGANPNVELWQLPIDPDIAPVELMLDHHHFEYIDDVRVLSTGELMAALRTRDQREVAWVHIDAGAPPHVIATDRDDDFVDTNSGWGVLSGDGPLAQRLVTVRDVDGGRRVVLGGDNATVISPSDVQVHSVVSVGASDVWFSGNHVDAAHEQQLWRWRADDGSVGDAGDGAQQITQGSGVFAAAVRGGVGVIRSTTIDSPSSSHRTLRGTTIASRARPLPFVPRVEFVRLGTHHAPAAIVLPRDGRNGPLPVLLDPYGGPHAQRVLASAHAFASAQWFADQGMAIIVIDGAGTPGVGSQWERRIAGDFLTAPVIDQIDGLMDAGARYPQLDLTKVAIRGWSFGGYLAAAAVLERPDVIHAAIVGAPVTDWRLYDTGYTERYLGHPDTSPAAYEQSSVLTRASQLQRPMLIVHGNSDDNVVVANSLQLSSALLAAGKPHETLILSGVSHMTPQPHVAENLLWHQIDFLRRSLDF